MERAGGSPSLVAVCGRLCEPPARPDRGPLPAWSADPELVRTVHDELRYACAVTLPTPAHDALARVQHLLGPQRCTLATTATDGLLHKASAEDILELRGSVFRLACAAQPDGHPRVPIAGLHHGWLRCVACGSDLRPDVVLPGEPLRHPGLLADRIAQADHLVLIEVEDDLGRELAEQARRARVHTVAVGTRDLDVDERLTGPIDEVVPALLDRLTSEGPGGPG